LIGFLDASALVKCYVEESGSRAVVAAVRDRAVAIARLSLVEVASALCRRCRAGDLAVADRDRLLSALTDDSAAFHVVELTAEVAAEASKLLRRHPLRSSDAIQLASLLVLGRALDEMPVLLSFDDALSAAGEAEAVPLHH
jgi:predicted nucleic acid-binding protein